MTTLTKYLLLPILLLTIACLILLSWNASTPHDIWWQMSNGRLITETGSFVSTDQYTFTINGHPYLDKYWFYELLTYKAYNAFGWTGLTALRMLFVLCCGGALAFSIKKKPLWLLFLLIAPAIVLLDIRILIRAYWFTLIMIPLFLRICEKAFAKDQRSFKYIIILCGLQIIWTNLHGEFFWGFLIAGLFYLQSLISDLTHKAPTIDITKKASCFILIILASILNPFGTGLFTGLISEARVITDNALPTEWMPFIYVMQPMNGSAWLILFLITCFTLYRSGKKVSVPLLILFIFFAALSQYSMRFIGIFTLLSIYVAMEHGENINLKEKSEENLHSISSILCIISLMSIIWLVCLGFFYQMQAERKIFGFGVITSEFPVRSSEFIKKNNINGDFINSWSHGGYLIWHNWPDIKIARDGRTAPFNSTLSNQLDALVRGNTKALAKFEEQYGPDGAIIPWQYLELARNLSKRPDWHLLFLGPNSSVWMTDKALNDQNKQHLALGQKDISQFIIRTEHDSFATDSYLTFMEHAQRRTIFFDAIGRKDMAEEQMLIARENL